MNHYTKFVMQKRSEGYTEYEASQLPGAREAAEMDKAASNKSFDTRSVDGHMENWFRSRVEGGLPPHFTSQEEMLQLMSDPAYKSNAEYREAVARIISITPAESIGVAGSAKSATGQVVKLGRNQIEEAATPQTMLRNAYREMVMEKLRTFDSSSAEGRYNRLKFIQENQEMVAEIERMTTSGEQLRRNELLAAQAGNGALKIQLGDDQSSDSSGVVHKEHPKDLVTRADGSIGYRDGSSLPSGEAFSKGERV